MSNGPAAYGGSFDGFGQHSAEDFLADSEHRIPEALEARALFGVRCQLNPLIHDGHERASDVLVRPNPDLAQAPLEQPDPQRRTVRHRGG